MRISDWSSDVCSSDLSRCFSLSQPATDPASSRARIAIFGFGTRRMTDSPDSNSMWGGRFGGGPAAIMQRSEEHTSELQSLMRISYAVFCLNKKNKPSTISVTTLHIYMCYSSIEHITDQASKNSN